MWVSHQHTQSALLLLLRHGRVGRGARLRDPHQRGDHALEQVGALQVAVVVHKEVDLRRCTMGSQSDDHPGARLQAQNLAIHVTTQFVHSCCWAHQQLAVARERLKAAQHHAALSQVHWWRRCMADDAFCRALHAKYTRLLPETFRICCSKKSPCIHTWCCVYNMT